jgi:lysozyme family protein
MAKTEVLQKFILKKEGGYVNRRTDKGGPTNKGVTITTFRSYYGANATVEQLKKITDEQWLYIFQKGYWFPFKGDYISNQSIANICVDWAWISGTKTAIKQVQTILGVTADGIVGNITLNAINSANQKELFDKIFNARIRFVNNIVRRDPTQAEYINGWINRINSIKFEAE